ncbi:MAG: hypothetical protein M3N53_06080 [Actinomycetota bacterium]|nr:hypothetical protein [Actinomycetota bacterium]
MKRLLVAVMVGSLVLNVATVPVSAAKRKKPNRVERTIEAPYEAPAAGVAVGGEFYGACKHGDGAGCILITPKPGELFARVEIADALSLPVHGFITDIEANHIVAEFCGTTEKTVFLGSDEQFLVWVFAGPCSDGTPAMASSGTITTVLSNLP